MLRNIRDKTFLFPLKGGRKLCLAFYFNTLFNENILEELLQENSSEKEEILTLCLGFLKFNLANFQKGDDKNWYSYFLNQDRRGVPKPLLFYFGFYHGAYFVPNCSPKYSLAPEQSISEDILRKFDWNYIENFLRTIFFQEEDNELIGKINRPDKYLLAKRITFFRKELVLNLIPKNILIAKNNATENLNFEEKRNFIYLKSQDLNTKNFLEKLKKSVVIFFKFQLSQNFLNNLRNIKQKDDSKIYQLFFKSYHNNLLKPFQKEIGFPIKIAHFVSYDWFDFATLIIINLDNAQNNLPLDNVLRTFKQKVILNELTIKDIKYYPFLRTETDVLIGHEAVDYIELFKLPPIFLRISSRFMEQVGYTQELLKKIQIPIKDLYSVELMFGIRDLILLPKGNNSKIPLREFITKLENLLNISEENKRIRIISDIQILPYTDVSSGIK